MTEAIKHAVFRKHMSLLAAGIRSDYFDERPTYAQFSPNLTAWAIKQIWGK